MLGFSWNATLNRLGAGLTLFFVGSALPEGVDYLGALTLQGKPLQGEPLLEGILLLVASYFLGTALVSAGRAGLPNQQRIVWVNEFAEAAALGNQLIQGELISIRDRSDAFAGLGAVLLTCGLLSPFYFAKGEFEPAIWLLLGAIAALPLLGFARIEHKEATELLSLLKEKSSQSQ